MRARKARFWFAVLVLAIPLCCSAATQPADTVALWEGVRTPHGKEVMLYTFRPEKPNGISVIVCPGGSYHWHDQVDEGFKVTHLQFSADLISLFGIK